MVFVGKSVTKSKKSFEKRNCKFHSNYNVGRNEALLTIPLYMAFLLDLAPEDVVLEPIDTNQLTQLAKEALTDRWARDKRQMSEKNSNFKITGYIHSIYKVWQDT